MEYLDLIYYILLSILAVLPVFYIVCLYISHKRWKKKNKDNILSKKIVYENCTKDITPTLTEMIDYNKNNEIIRYTIDYFKE